MESLNNFTPLFGFVLFSVYMRYFLTPISTMTWANLNHTLCGIDNDPWRVYFGMNKYYYFWAELYLGFTSTVFTYINVGLSLCFSALFKLLKITSQKDDKFL